MYQVTNKGQSDEVSLYFYYDETGIAAFVYRSAEHPTDNGLYYYIRNPQGDILGIVDRTGTLIARYDYSAYGEYRWVWTPEEVSTELFRKNSRIINANPFQYRGYYYDEETGLYYCQSRYYDPEVGRWLNADGIINSISFLGYNLYTYCLNNPVNLIDTNGREPILFTLSAIAIVLLKAITLATMVYCVSKMAVKAISDFNIEAPNVNNSVGAAKTEKSINKIK